MRGTLGLGIAIWFAVGAGAIAQAIHGREGITLPAPPAVDAVPVADDYFGTRIPDSYRWLEDGKSTNTRAFIDAQNAYTSRYMKQARIRSQTLDDLDELENVSEWRFPMERAGSYFFRKRLAGEQQFSIYIRRNWATQKGTPKDERIIDPEKLGRDPNTSVSLADVSRDGKLVAYAVQQGGADEASIRVFNSKTGKTLEDELPTARYFSVDFAPDGASLYYARNNKQGTLLYQHVLGTRNSRDTLIFGREFRGEELTGDDLFSGVVTDDGRYLVVTIDRGVPARRVDIIYRDLTKPGSTFEVLVWGLDSRFNAIYARGGWYVKTDYKSPKGRILKADPGIMPDVWKTIVPEGPDAIADWTIVGGKVYVNRLKDVKSETAVYTLDGKPSGSIDFDGIGLSSVVWGRTTDRYGFFSFQSFIVPPTIYRLDTADRQARGLLPAEDHFRLQPIRAQAGLLQVEGRDPNPHVHRRQEGPETRRNRAAADDRLRRLQHQHAARTGARRQHGGWSRADGSRCPTCAAAASTARHWHEQGMFEKKQNVFDDWFAAADYLIANKYTSPAALRHRGRVERRPADGRGHHAAARALAAVLCGFPLLDMLRFQKFLVGSYWITEYGSSDKEKQFPYLLKYSPYQNVKAGTAYPASMFFTGDSDTRVDPLHARKMTALLQAASTSGRPILLHYSVAGGHSGGMSVDQQIQDDADSLSFLWTETAQPAHGK